PTTIRDGMGRLGDQFTYPLTYLEDDSTRYIIRGVSVIDLRASLLDLDGQLEQTYDKYAFVRSVWLQRREFQVRDGEVDETDLGLEEGFEEDLEAPAEEESAAPE